MKMTEKKIKKGLILITVCIHWTTIWKIVNCSKFVVLLKYKIYLFIYYYYYFYYNPYQQQRQKKIYIYMKKKLTTETCLSCTPL